MTRPAWNLCSRTKCVSTSRGGAGSCAAAIALALTLWAGSGCGVWTSGKETAPTLSPDFPTGLLAKPATVAGALPLQLLLQQLQSHELLVQYPPGPTDQSVDVLQGSRWYDVCLAVERATGWIYDTDTKRFLAPAATHSVDTPDAAGRAETDRRLSLSRRQQITLRWRFARIAGNVTEDGGGVNGQAIDFAASVPQGVFASWSVTQERSYYEGVTDPANPNADTVVRTTKRVVNAGLQYGGLAAVLPGGGCRLDGILSISTFTGLSTDRSVVNVPLQLDGERGKWMRVMVLNTGDAGIRMSFRALGLNLGASADRVVILARID